MRKPLIAANWKMYKTPAEAAAFVQAFDLLVAHHHHADIVLFPSASSLAAVVGTPRSKHIQIGGQDMHWLNEGAYTGATSPLMLKAIGCTHVLIGHSERRQYFNETDTTVNLKLKSALAHDLIPIVCIGEHLNERESDLTAKVLELQVAVALEGIDPTTAHSMIFAYEPVWAIGTGRTATPATAEQAHKLIRGQIAASLTPAIAASTRILYGGSVRPENAATLCCLEDIDGALVGGASLDPNSFAEIIIQSKG
ncbi:triose-phosphate isomerase [Granulicella sp. dw_53]|uniref:triose-phosphate isomerase n=1 Tax=Granulicella sp. dw_53 TaxID=2719792 RepID=UPI001BD25D1E|nr:triose-phosphate isomerase [Granulicella sp. dw_53]